MSEVARPVRRTFSGGFLYAIVAFAVEGVVDPGGIHSIPSRTIQVLLAIALVVGMVPGSYLWRLIRLAGERISTVRRGRGIGLGLAIGGPLFFLALYGMFAAGYLGLIRRSGDQGFLVEFLFSLTVVVIQLTVLALNVFDLARGSSGSSRA